MTWRLSRALVALRAEVNREHPGRDFTSDGTIGDPSHQARQSDHNPDAFGRVMAWDVTKGAGVAQAVVDFILRTRPARIKYVIWEDRIMSGPGQGHPPWVWRPYQPNNPRRNQHRHHAHISFQSDDPAPWGYPDGHSTVPNPPNAPGGFLMALTDKQQTELATNAVEARKAALLALDRADHAAEDAAAAHLLGVQQQRRMEALLRAVGLDPETLRPLPTPPRPQG